MKKLLALLLLICITASVFSCGKAKNSGAEQTAETYVDKYGTNPDGKKVVESGITLLTSEMLYSATLYGDGTFDAVSFGIDRTNVNLSNFNYNFSISSIAGNSNHEGDNYIEPCGTAVGVEFKKQFLVKGTYTLKDGLYTFNSERRYIKCYDFKGENAERFLSGYGDLLTGTMKENRQAVDSIFAGKWTDITDINNIDRYFNTVSAVLSERGKDSRHNYYWNLILGNIFYSENDFPADFISRDKAFMPLKIELSLYSNGKKTGSAVLEFYENFHKKYERVYDLNGALSYGFDYSFEYYDNNEPKTVTETTIPTNKTRNYKIDRYDYYDNGLLKTITKEVAEAHYEREGESYVDPAYKNITEYTYYDDGGKKTVTCYTVYEGEDTKNVFAEYEWYQKSDGGNIKKLVFYRNGEIYLNQEYDKTGEVINSDSDPNQNSYNYTYYDNGMTKKSERYKNGKLSRITEYHENGEGKSSVDYDDDGNVEKTVNQVIQNEYYEDGKIKTKSVYCNDVISRIFQYYQNGNKKSETAYANGTILYYREYYESGNTRISENYNKGVLSYKSEYAEDSEYSISYNYSNGMISSTYEVSADGKTSTSTLYDNHGNVTSTSTYEKEIYSSIFDIYD